MNMEWKDGSVLVIAQGRRSDSRWCRSGIAYLARLLRRAETQSSANIAGCRRTPWRWQRR